MREHPENYENITVIFPQGGVNEVLSKHVKLLLVFNNLLPCLFKFSYAVAIEDGKYAVGCLRVSLFIVSLIYLSSS